MDRNLPINNRSCRGSVCLDGQPASPNCVPALASAGGTVADDDEDEDSPPMGAWQFVTLHLPLS